MPSHIVNIFDFIPQNIIIQINEEIYSPYVDGNIANEIEFILIKIKRLPKENRMMNNMHSIEVNKHTKTIRFIIY